MSLSDLLKPFGCAPKCPQPPNNQPPQDDGTTQQDATAKKCSPPPALDRQQQEFLCDVRTELPRKINTHLAARQWIKEQYSRLLNHTQRGTWESFHDLTQCLEQYGALSQTGIIIFGGWHRKPDPLALKAPSCDLTIDLYSLNIYSEVLARINTLFLKYPPEKEALQAVWDWVNEFPQAFAAAGTDDSRTIGGIERVAKESVSSLVPRIQEHLLFMETQAFIFYPTPDNPAAGWKEFFAFMRGYNCLPDSIKRSFKSHYLIIQTPSQ